MKLGLRLDGRGAWAAAVTTLDTKAAAQQRQERKSFEIRPGIVVARLFMML